jgi:hypothetical protein
MKEGTVADAKDTTKARQERDEQDPTNIEGKPAESKSKKPAGPLGNAAESSDPAVHKLLADRQTAAMNGDKDAADAASDELRKLGVE